MYAFSGQRVKTPKLVCGLQNSWNCWSVSPLFWQRCTLETWHMRSQPHPLNREEGILPHVYDALVDNTPRVHGLSLSRQN